MEENKLENEEITTPPGNNEPAEHDPLASLDEAHEEQEHHEDPEAAVLAELEEEEQEKFDTSTLEQLHDVLHQALRDDRVKEFRKSFNQIKRRFRDLFEEEKNRVLHKFLEDGEKQEDFQFYPPEDMLRVRELVTRFNERLAELRKREEQEVQANILAKQDVIHELKLLISEESDIKKAFDRFHQLREKWASIGNVPQQYAQDLWNNYKFFTDKFYEFVQINKELYELDLNKNLEVKQQLIRRVEGLMQLPSIKKSIEMLHGMQKEWRETGPVPKAVTKDIFDQFKAAVDSVYLRRDQFIREREESRQKNLEAKTALCERAEALAAKEVKSLGEWKKEETELKKLDEQWKGIGRVPRQFNDSIWERFKGARREFYRKKLPLLKHIKDELTTNYDAKVRLCEQAEALKENTDWKNTTHQFLKLQADWKKIGPVERKKSDEIWQRFRQACDAFFHAKEQFYAGQGEREAGNLTKKQELIAQVKAYVPVEDMEANLAYIRQMQQEWNAAGHVPIADKQSVEKEFDAAINTILAGMNIDKDKRNRMEYKMKLEGMIQSPQADRLLKEERTFVGNKVRKLEEEITQIENNLGFFGHSKGADSLKKQYEDKIARLREELTLYTDRRNLIKNAIKAMESKG